jgi:HEAT repeat protein
MELRVMRAGVVIGLLGMCIAWGPLGQAGAQMPVALPGAEAEGGGTGTQEPARAWTCPMHPQIRAAGPGRCPICGMALTPVKSPETAVTVPEEQFVQYCKDYVKREFRERPDHAAGGYQSALVSALVDIEGEAALPTLRKLLADEDLDYVAAAAYRLGELKDRPSIPALKELLASDRLKWPLDAPGPVSGNLVSAWASTAGALHAMGEKEGLDGLVTASAKWPILMGCLAVRDTPEVEEVLKDAAQSDKPGMRALGVQTLLVMGHKEYMPQALELLETAREGIRLNLIAAVARDPSPEAEAALKRVADASAGDLAEQIAVLTAASGLVHLGQLDYMAKIEAAAKGGQVAGYAIDLLGEVGGKEQLDLLRRVVEEDPHNRPVAVAAAIHIMKRAGDLSASQ